MFIRWSRVLKVIYLISISSSGSFYFMYLNSQALQHENPRYYYSILRSTSKDGTIPALPDLTSSHSAPSISHTQKQNPTLQILNQE